MWVINQNVLRVAFRAYDPLILSNTLSLRTWPFDGVSGAAAALARRPAPTARRSALWSTSVH
jgi:hypothetical protein